MVGFLPGCDEFVPHTMEAMEVWDAQGLDEFRHQAQNKTPLVLQTEACWQGKFQASVWSPLEEWFINVHNINWAMYIHLHQEKG